MNQAELEKAHKASNHNRETIQQSETAGCFYCQNLFPAKQVSECSGDSAICPYCGVDSVIGDASGYAITPEFLRTMNRFWFSRLFGGQPKRFSENEVGQIVAKLDKIAKEVDPNSEVEPYIRSVLHGESFAVVCRRLQVVIDFTPFDE